MIGVDCDEVVAETVRRGDLHEKIHHFAPPLLVVVAAAVRGRIHEFHSSLVERLLESLPASILVRKPVLAGLSALFTRLRIADGRDLGVFLVVE